MLKFYVNRDKNNAVQCFNIVSPVPQNCNNVCDTQNSQNFENKIPDLSPLQNSNILCNLDSKLVHLEDSKKQELKNLYMNTSIYFLMCQQKQTKFFMMWM